MEDYFLKFHRPRLGCGTFHPGWMNYSTILTIFNVYDELKNKWSKRRQYHRIIERAQYNLGEYEVHILVVCPS